MTELKPCPNCGEHLEILGTMPVETEEGYETRICCWNCEHLGPVRRTDEEAVEAWNAEGWERIKDTTTPQEQP